MNRDFQSARAAGSASILADAVPKLRIPEWRGTPGDAILPRVAKGKIRLAICSISKL